MTTQTEVAKEGGHWYDASGAPRYTIMGLNGQDRPTTLRDARQNGWLPSVTTILKVAAAPGLEKWKRDQILLSALTLPRVEGETLESFGKRIQEDSEAQGKAARDLGTAIHGSLERAFQGLLYPAEHKAIVEAVFAVVEPYKGTGWQAERSFAGNGYGGKIDLYSNLAVIDYKTKAFGPEAKVEKLAWPEMEIQLSSYDKGLELHPRKRINVFVSTTNPGLVKLHEWPDNDMAWEKFKCLLKYWQLSKGYAP